jgi:L-glyceraldehyde 3-phosphate reductase
VQRDRLSWNKFSAEPARYDRMQFRRCGSFGLKLPAISLGAWETFGGYRGAETTRECIFIAFNLGITHFDLANSYGSIPGRAETFVGRVLREMPREELLVSTKAGFPIWPGPTGEGASRKHLFAAIDQSLQRIGLDHVDIFYSHRPDPETPLAETLGALEQIVQQGKARYVGLSRYPGAIFEQACRESRLLRNAPVIVQQATYSLLAREKEKELLELSRATGAGFVACSPLMEGLLSTKYLDGFPEESRAAKAWNDRQRASVSDSLKERIRQLNDIATARGQTLPQMAIAWVLSHREVTTALMGASDIKQIEENAKALENLTFSEDEWRRIDEITAATNR